MGSTTNTIHQEFFIQLRHLNGAADLLFWNVLDDHERGLFKRTSFMPNDGRFTRDTFNHIMVHIGWACKYSPSGDVTELIWENQRWTEQADKSLNLIARYVAPCSYIAFENDEAVGFKYLFNNHVAVRHDYSQIVLAWSDKVDIEALFRRTARTLLGEHDYSRDQLHAIIDELVAREVIAS